MSRLASLLMFVGLVMPLGAWEITADICGPGIYDEAEDIAVLSNHNILVAGRCMQYSGSVQTGPLFIALFSSSGTLLYDSIFSTLPAVGGDARPLVWVVPFTSITDRFWIAFRGSGVLDISCGTASCTVHNYVPLPQSIAGVSTDPSDVLFVLQYGSSGPDPLTLTKIGMSGIIWNRTDTLSGSLYHLAIDSNGNAYIAFACNNTCLRAYRGTDGARFWTAQITGGIPVDIEVAGEQIYGTSRDIQIWDSTGADLVVYTISIRADSVQWKRIYHHDINDLPSDLVVVGNAIKVFGASNYRPLFGSFRATDGLGGAQIWTTQLAAPPNVYGGFNSFDGVRTSNDRYLVYNPYDNMYYAVAFAKDTTASCSNPYCRPMVIRYNAAGSVYGSWLASDVDSHRSIDTHNAALAVDASTGMVYATSMVQDNIWLMQIPPYMPICRKCQLDRVNPGAGQISLEALSIHPRVLVFDLMGRRVGVFAGSSLKRKLSRGVYWVMPLQRNAGQGDAKRVRIVIP